MSAPGTPSGTGGIGACPDRPPGWRVGKILLALVLLILIARGVTMVDWGRWPDLSRLTVESALDDTVLVDVRMRVRSGQVDGPVAQRLPPGGAVTFTATAGQVLCVRVIVPGENRVISFQLEESDQAASTALRLRPVFLQRPPPGSTRCEAELARHRVRPAPGRYFEPHRPETIRRERILSRRRL